MWSANQKAKAKMREVQKVKRYARRNKRKQLNVKYRWRGMAKTNTRKHNRRMRYKKGDE